MQKFFYPESDLDKSRALLNVLGSFWSRTYTGTSQLNSYARATALAVAQTQLNLLETVAALSSYDIPVFHTENWYPLVLRKSERNTTIANKYKFNESGLTFNSGPALQFDAFANRDFYAFPAPDKFVGAGQIFDRLIFPSFALIGGTDFVVEDGAIIFTRDPFEDTTVSRQPIYEGDNLVDEEITLWAFKASLDYEYVFTQFAYAVNIRLESSDNAKQLVSAVISGLVAGGASDNALNGVLSAIFDVPLVKEEREVVEVITLDNHGLFIATDKTVYRFNAAATPIVAVGQVVYAGDILTDTFEIIDLNRGVIPATLKALALDSGFTAACFYSDLIFENKEVPLIVDSTHPSGYTYVSFPLAGFPPDLQRFFDELHARGIEGIPETPAECDKTGANRRLGTLAHILDRRKDRAGEPQAGDLPATINPLQFLVENILRNNAAIVRVKVSGLGKNHLGLYNIRNARQLVPPYAALLFIYDLDGRKDTVIGPDSLEERITQFKGLEPAQDVIAVNLVQDRGIMVRTVSGTCQ